jgi:hypothetical protein
MARHSSIRISELSGWFDLKRVGLLSALFLFGGRICSIQLCTSLNSVLFPGGIADCRGQIAYLVSGTQIDAVNLDSGTTRWRSMRASRPLLITDDDKAVVALGFDEGRPQILLLSVSDGEVMRLIEFDTTIQAGIESFALDFEKLDGALLLHWRVSSKFRGGANPSVDRRGNERLAGSTRIDIETGRAQTQETIPDTPLREPESPATIVMGSRSYSLVSTALPEIPGSPATLYLECSDSASGRHIWSYPLGVRRTRKQREQIR